MKSLEGLQHHIFIVVACVVLTYTSSALSADNSAYPNLSVLRWEQTPTTPESVYDFDIPLLPRKEAMALFAKTIRADHLPAKEQDDLSQQFFGPVQGRMTVGEALSKLIFPFCDSQVEEVVRNRIFDDRPRPFLKPPQESSSIPLNIPRTTRVKAMREVSRQFNGFLIAYMSTSEEEENELVGPLTKRMSQDEALRAIVEGTNLRVRWVGRAGPMASVAMPSYHFIVGHCKQNVLVTQSHLPSLEFGEVITIDRRKIDAIGASSVPETLSYLTEAGINKGPGDAASGGQYADFRGLGPDKWLVLINGRRAMPSANNVTTPAFDLGTIPLSAVDRIDIQLENASTRYGSDAVAGVINIVTFRESIRPRVEIRYGGARGGASERRATASFGVAGGAPWRASVVLDTFDTGGLLGKDRSLTANQDYSRFGGTDYRQLFGVRLADSSFVPLPSTPEPVSLYGYSSLVPDGMRSSIVAVGEHVGSQVTSSAELIWVQRTNRYTYFPAAVSGLVAADYPGNPYRQPVLVDALLTGLDSMEQHVESELTRAVLGFRGEISNWSWSASALSSVENTEAWIENEVDPAGVAQALINTEPSRVLDVFSQRPGADGLPAGVLANEQIEFFSSRGHQILLMGDGPLFSLPSGEVELRLGQEYRVESMRLNTSVREAERNVRSSHFEISIPFVGAAMHIPGVRELRATAGVRRDSYSDLSAVTAEQYSVTCNITDGLALGATHVQSNRPPSLFELRMPVVSFPTVVFDARQNRVVPIDLITGGNETLRATDGASHTVHVSYSATGTRVLARYFSLKLSDHIALLPPQTALKFEEHLPDRVHRAEPTGEELEAGIPGRLLAIDTRRLNYGRLSVSGIDFELMRKFRSRAGSLTSQLAATWINSFEFSDVPLAGYPMVDRTNLADGRGTITRWRVIGSLTWERGPLRSATHLRFIPSYLDDTKKNKHRIGSQTIWDVTAALALGKTTEITLGVRDILDTSPHWAHAGAATGYDDSQWDPVGRRWFLSVKQSF